MKRNRIKERIPNHYNFLCFFAQIKNIKKFGQFNLAEFRWSKSEIRNIITEKRSKMLNRKKIQFWSKILKTHKVVSRRNNDVHLRRFCGNDFDAERSGAQVHLKVKKLFHFKKDFYICADLLNEATFMNSYRLKFCLKRN